MKGFKIRFSQLHEKDSKLGSLRYTKRFKVKFSQIRYMEEFKVKIHSATWNDSKLSSLHHMKAFKDKFLELHEGFKVRITMQFARIQNWFHFEISKNSKLVSQRYGSYFSTDFQPCTVAKLDLFFFVVTSIKWSQKYLGTIPLYMLDVIYDPIYSFDVTHYHIHRILNDQLSSLSKSWGRSLRSPLATCS